MKKTQLHRLMLAAGLASTALTAVSAAAPAQAPTAHPEPASVASRPNIVVILVDDMGFSDIGAYGSEVPTPNIDALARTGLRFTQFYNSARCSPSRASLMTGVYPHEAGMGHLEAIAVPGSQGLHGKLDNRVVTLAEVLHSAGYFTAMAGKWHLGITRGVGPWQRGFDRSLASPLGELYYPDQPQPNAKFVYIDGRKVPANSPEVGLGHWYSSDLFVDWNTKFFKEAEAEHKPFFLYLPFTAVHFPLMAPTENVEKYKAFYQQGWEPLRRARLERQKALGIVPKDEALPEALANSYAWDKLTVADKERFASIMAVYAGDIERMDRAVGTLVQRLKDAREYDNTLILFMADNGGNAESGPDGRLRGDVPGSASSTVFAGMNWATLQNTPFQYFKHFTEEGGISTPLIAHWPDGIPARLEGSLARSPGHLVDIMATLVDVSGATYPKSFNGHEIVPMQGVSLTPAFHGRPVVRPKPIFWEHEGNRAVREGDWKIVSRFKHPWQLYDIAKDRGEMHDLAARYPALVKKMSAQYVDWARNSYVDPWSDAYDPYLDGRPRQNWGDASRIERPYAVRDEPIAD